MAKAKVKTKSKTKTKPKAKAKAKTSAKKPMKKAPHVKRKKGVIGILTGGGDVPGLNPAIRAGAVSLGNDLRNLHFPGLRYPQLPGSAFTPSDIDGAVIHSGLVSLQSG